MKESQALKLMLHEQFDLKLYQAFYKKAKDSALRDILLTMIQEEAEHVAIWKKYIGDERAKFSIATHFKYGLLILSSSIFGDKAIRLIVESIEVHGIRAYLRVAEEVQGTKFQAPLEQVLRDEFEHEASIIGSSDAEKRTGDTVRNFLLGFNDGLVELLGVVIGFYATLSSPKLIIVAGISVISAGSFSMAAGAFNATYAEADIDTLEDNKERFKQGKKVHLSVRAGTAPISAALTVGSAFVIGGLTILAPVFFGVTHVLYSILAAGVAIVLVAGVLAFVSGMHIRQQILLNFGVVVAAALFAMIVGTAIEFVLDFSQNW